MKTHNLLILFTLLLSIGLSSAQTLPNVVLKTGDSQTLVIPCFYNGNYCSSSSTCNLSVTYPDGRFLVEGALMDYNGTIHTYVMPPQNSTAIFTGVVSCEDNGYFGGDTFTITYTPTGTTGKSWAFLLIIGLGALIFIGLGLTLKNPYFGFIGGAAFLLIGVYTMLYGFMDTADLYTRGFSSILLGIGIFFVIVSAYEWTMETQFDGGGGWNEDTEE